MRSSLIRRFLMVSLLAGTTIGYAETKKAPPPAAKGGKTAPATKPPPPKKVTVVSADHKKVLAELYAGYKFGMSKDDVVAQLSKSIDEKYDEQLKKTTDVGQQDKLRKMRKDEIAEFRNGYVEFNGKKTGWDVSIVEDEFAHGTGESMLERWEKQGNSNQRRFFFFYEGKLWKMFVSLDVSILPEDKKNFDTFRSVMTSKYGPADLDVGLMSWHTDEFDVRAVDKLKTYDALGLSIEDNKVKKEIMASREAHAPAKHETSSVIKAVIDEDNKDHPDVKSNGNAVDAVIKAQKK